MPRPLGAAAILARKDIKGDVVANELNPVTVAGVVNVLGGDPERVQFLLYNLGASTIYMGFSGDVGATNGILVPPNGGFVGVNAYDDYDLATIAVYVSCTVAGNQLYILSTRRESAFNGE